MLTRFALLACVLAAACRGGADEPVADPHEYVPDDSAADESSSSDGEESGAGWIGEPDDGPDVCSAWVGCRRAGGSEVFCSVETHSNGDFCLDEFCDELVDTCGHSDPRACEELVFYCDDGESGAAEDCAAYIECRSKCVELGYGDACSWGCTELAGGDAWCSAYYCELAGMACATDEDACETWIEECFPGGTPETGTSEGDDSSTSTDGSSSSSSTG